MVSVWWSRIASNLCFFSGVESSVSSIKVRFLQSPIPSSEATVMVLDNLLVATVVVIVVDDSSSFTFPVFTFSLFSFSSCCCCCSSPSSSSSSVKGGVGGILKGGESSVNCDDAGVDFCGSGDGGGVVVVVV